MSLASLLEVINLRLNLLRDDLYEKLENIQLTKGDQGEKGDKGDQGPKGDKGDLGPAGTDGAKGQDGTDGQDGLDGISVTDATVDFDNHLTITLSDGSEIDAGKIEVQTEEGAKALNINGVSRNTVIELITTIGGSEEVAYAQRLDKTTQYTYVGEAIPGSVEADAAWRIKRLEFLTDGDIVTLWADGDSNFDNVWTNHLTLSYS